MTEELIVGTVVSMECEEGYGPMLGNHNSTCTSDFHWEPVIPGCQGKTRELVCECKHYFLDILVPYIFKLYNCKFIYIYIFFV